MALPALNLSNYHSLQHLCPTPALLWSSISIPTDMKNVENTRQCPGSVADPCADKSMVQTHGQALIQI